MVKKHLGTDNRKTVEAPTGNLVSRALNLGLGNLQRIIKLQWIIRFREDLHLQKT